VYPSRSLQTDGIKAFSVTSFGFGQKGAQAIGIHPKYLFATLDRNVFETYKIKVSARQKKAYRYFHDGFINNRLFRAKDKAPYADEHMSKVFLDPTARVAENPRDASFQYKPQPTTSANKTAATTGKDQPQWAGTTPSTNPQRLAHTRATVEHLAAAAHQQHSSPNSRVGVDVESVSAVPCTNETFVARNFTKAEQAHCEAAPDRAASYAGRWAAKEAVFKSLGVQGQGGGAAMREIEVERDEKGGPIVKLHGVAKQKADEAGVKSVVVSISHTDEQAVAVAVAHF